MSPRIPGQARKGESLTARWKRLGPTLELRMNWAAAEVIREAEAWADTAPGDCS